MNRNGRKQATWPRVQSTGGEARKGNRTSESSQGVRGTQNALSGWARASRIGSLGLGAGTRTPQSAMTPNEESVRLRQQVKEQEKATRRIKKGNEFLEEASAFFAASRPKSAKTKE